MLQSTTIAFLSGLKKHNDKNWFDGHRDEYAEAKADFEQQVDALLAQMTALDAAFAGQKAKDSIFRIFRDVRFSKDKTPYKPNFGAFMSRGGRKFEGAGYYLHVEPGGKSFAGGGLWMPDAPILKKVRQEIDYNFEAFQRMLQEKSFRKYFSKLEGERLKTPPQGYDAGNPAIEFLKMKSFTVITPLSDEMLTAKSLEKNLLSIFTAMQPLVDFLNRALD